MKPIIEHVCPGCGRVVGQTKRQRAAVGKPFDECPHCHAFVPRVPYNEWALMSSSSKAGILGTQGVLAVALGLLPAVVVALIGILARREEDLVTLLIVTGIGLFVSLSAWLSQVAHTLGRSRRRMSDPMYQARLVQFAIDQERARGKAAAAAAPQPFD